MTKLNKRIFFEVDKGDFLVNLDDWVFKNGEMIRYEDVK